MKIRDAVCHYNRNMRFGESGLSLDHLGCVVPRVHYSMLAGDDTVLCTPVLAISEDWASVARISLSLDDNKSPDTGVYHVAFILDYAERTGCVVVDWLSNSTSSLVPYNGNYFPFSEKFGMAHQVRGVQRFIMQITSFDVFSNNRLTSASGESTLRTGLDLCQVVVASWLQIGDSSVPCVRDSYVRVNTIGALLGS
jgi:hypothetical protein